MHLSHLFHVATCEVVIDGDDKGRFASEGVDVAGEGGHKRFSFSGGHFGKAAVVKDETSEELDIVVALFNDSPGLLLTRKTKQT